MKVLLINHYAGSPHHGMEFRPFYFARQWVRDGHEVEILAASFSHLRAKNPASVWLRRSEVLEGIRYKWFRTPAYNGNGVGRVVNMLTFLAWLVVLIPRMAWRRPDVVIASSTYPLDMVPAWVAARLCGARLVFEVHDLWPLSPKELGQLSDRHPFILLMQWGENFAYRHCDLCVSLLPKAFEHMRAHGLNAERYLYIPNGIDPEEWQTEVGVLDRSHREALVALRARHPFVLGYVGSHGLANALDTLLEAVSECRDERLGVVMIGGGPERARLQGKAASLGLEDRMVFLPPLPKRQVPSALAHMDALYIGWARSSLYRFGISPNKLFDYMMAGKPILHAIEAGNDPVREAGCGISVGPENVSFLVEGLEQLMGVSPEERAGMGGRGREFVLRHHRLDTLARTMMDAMSVAAGGRA
jgi:glycosyltransferase involved in cell wall biosynthesis